MGARRVRKLGRGGFAGKSCSLRALIIAGSERPRAPLRERRWQPLPPSECPASWPATRQGRLGIRPPPAWIQPNSLSLDRSFSFSVGDGAAAGCRTCGAQPPWPSAIGSASGRTGECVPTIGASTLTLAAPGGADEFPCKSARPSLRTLRVRTSKPARASISVRRARIRPLFTSRSGAGTRGQRGSSRARKSGKPKRPDGRSSRASAG